MRRLRWGLIGGGESSQIGEAHRSASRLDGRFELTAAALDIDPERGVRFAAELGVSRAYGTWQEMLQAERNHPDRLDLVTVATPNNTHYEISKAFLDSGFDVLCEKPLTTSVADADDLVRVAERADRICAVNFGYTGYPLVRQARAMVARGDLGRIRVVTAEFAHGFHADSADADNPRVRWRYDPEQAGESAVLADAGIHALHMAGYVIGQKVTRLSADFASCVAGRQLEDDALLALRFDGGAVGRLWTSAIAAGQIHGLSLRVFGEKGGLKWRQEQPNQLYWKPVNDAVRILERGDDGLYPEATRCSRVTVGHVEGMVGAFANLYRDLAELITARHDGREADPLARAVPTAAEGRDMVLAVHRAVQSSAAREWMDL